MSVNFPLRLQYIFKRLFLTGQPGACGFAGLQPRNACETGILAEKLTNIQAGLVNFILLEHGKNLQILTRLLLVYPASPYEYNFTHLMFFVSFLFLTKQKQCTEGHPHENLNKLPLDF